MNEAEASKKAQEMIAHRLDVFCPFIPGRCNIACECYKMPEAYQWGEDMKDPNTYAIKYGFCTCYALKGDVP